MLYQSDDNHECCRNCQLATSNVVCYASQSLLECFSDKSFCNGTSKYCPPQPPKRAGSSCSTHEKGQCNASGQCLSVCQQKSLGSLPCLCSNNENRCVQCCQSPSNHTKCVPYHVLYPNEQIIYLTDGRNCIEGICKNVRIS